MPQGILFLTIGAANTLVAYGIFVSLHLAFADMPYLVNLGLTYVFASAVSFLSQKYVVFKVRKHVGLDFVRFQVSGGLVLLINGIVLVLLVEMAGLGVLVSQALAAVISVWASFFLHKFFSFRRPSPSETRA